MLERSACLPADALGRKPPFMSIVSLVRVTGREPFLTRQDTLGSWHPSQVVHSLELYHAPSRELYHSLPASRPACTAGGCRSLSAPMVCMASACECLTSLRLCGGVAYEKKTVAPQGNRGNKQRGKLERQVRGSHAREGDAGRWESVQKDKTSERGKKGEGEGN